MVEKLGNSMRPAAVFLVAAELAMLICLCSCSPSPDERLRAEAQTPSQFDETNPLGANAACYVCHIPFVKEEFSKRHLKAKITCVRCHGVSAGHANDEDIGATKPDITFERDRIDAMCLKCHKKHDVADSERLLICTDCHNTHRINRAIPQKE